MLYVIFLWSYFGIINERLAAKVAMIAMNHRIWSSCHNNNAIQYTRISAQIMLKKNYTHNPARTKLACSPDLFDPQLGRSCCVQDLLDYGVQNLIVIYFKELVF